MLWFTHGYKNGFKKSIHFYQNICSGAGIFRILQLANLFIYELYVPMGRK